MTDRTSHDPTTDPGDDAPAVTDDPFVAYEGARPEPDGRPWVLANMVVGLDGSLSWQGRVGPLSSEADRSLFVRLRGVADAVMVGAATVRAEGYGPVRLPAARRGERLARGRAAVPPMVVVSRSLDLDWDSELWSPAVPSPSIVLTVESAPAAALAAARERAEVIVAGETSVDLGEAMAALAERGVRTLLTEGGPTLLDELISVGLLDELCLTLTPRFGGDPLTMAGRARPADELAEFCLEGVLRHGDELYLRYLLHRAGGEPA